MQFLVDLWLPIILTSVVLFFVSAAAWMALPHHKQDYGKLPGEDAFMDSVRSQGIEPGRYVFPNSGSHQNAQDPEYRKKFEQGPVGTLIVFGKVSMGKNMLLTVLFFLVANILLAYLGDLAMGDRTQVTFAFVFRFMSTAGVIAYSLAAIPNDIWFRRPTLTNIVDGVAYGLITGLIYAALWPK